MIPFWLHALSVIALLVGAACALVIAIDVARHPQTMWIMNLVWPITALYSGPLAMWGYFRHGRNASHHGHAGPKRPFWVSVAIGDTHCGAGCTVGDMVAEWCVFFMPTLAVWFGYQLIFSEKMFAVWILDYVLAFIFGIVFQYFNIAPMRGLGFREGTLAALKSDALSLTAWQIGMYGFMALAQFGYFFPLTGKAVETNTPEFWFTMQIAMLAGFATAYPVNWWLIRSGIKEAM